MAELRSKADGSSMNTLNSPVKPHRPGRTITCYYCGLILHEKYLQTHMKQCPLVLEGCPKKCGVTTERQAMHNHLENECMNVRRPTAVKTKTKSSSPSIWDLSLSLLNQHLQYDDQKSDTPEEWNDKVVAAIMVMKNALLKEENERCRAEAEWKNEIKKLEGQLQASEMNSNKNTLPQITMVQFLELKEEIIMLKESLAEERRKRHEAEQQLAYEIDKTIILSQQIDDLTQRTQDYTNRNEAWKSDHKEEMDRILQEFTQERQQRLRAETELKMEAAKLEDLCYNLEHMKEKDEKQRCILEDQHRKCEDVWKEEVKEQRNTVDELRKAVANCNENIDDFREFLSSENVMISGLWAEQLAETQKITEQIDALSRVLEAKSKQLAQLEQRVIESDEIILKNSRGINVPINGHILWKISDFEGKMKDAKENDTALHSPVFYSSEHGYKLRIELRLNGLGQWTGRHMTASLQVLEGEWDPLLTWPFSKKVTLTLSDQSTHPDKVNNLVKSLAEGREKEDPAGLHVFIPHATLQQYKYIMNNTMFLEVNVI